VRGSLENLIHTVDRTSGTTVIPGMMIRYISEERRGQIIPFGPAGKVNAKRSVTMAVSHTFVKETLVEAVRETIMDVAREEYTLAEFLVSV
jgi:hypothetical protein